MSEFDRSDSAWQPTSVQSAPANRDGKKRYAIGVAAEAARELQRLLEPCCTKIRIVGSLGRCDPKHPRTWPNDVGDIELLAVPAGVQGPRSEVQGQEEERVFRLCREEVRLNTPKKLPSDALEKRLADLLRCDAIHFDPVVKRNGPRYKRLLFRGIPVDLFIVRPPADWGVLCAIRTGPEAWSKTMVKKREWGGLIPAGMCVKDGQLLVSAPGVISKRPCPEEGHFFQALGIPWVAPFERTAERLQEILASRPCGPDACGSRRSW